MPRYNGTGPRGQGPLTGRGMGYCAQRTPGYDTRGYGRGIGCGMGRGFGRGLGYAPIVSEREMLEENMRYLEEELNAVKAALGNTKED
ncbi:MAG: DUF5320 domain-containing protein [Gudongella sp.]|nr:DUF5320 domain-containing protein [Gudongella sp.]